MNHSEKFYPVPYRKLYPVPECRHFLGDISHQTFYNLVGNGSIRLTKIGRRSFLTFEEICRYVESLSETDPASPKSAAEGGGHG